MTHSGLWADIDWTAHEHVADIGGARVKYLDYGDGPPLLLIHGMAGTWTSWMANLPELGERYRVIAVDLPGFGGSDPLPRRAPFGGYVERLLGLLDHLGIPSVAVFGHSLGGLVTLAFASRAPKRVRCVVLVSGGGVELSRVRLAAIQGVFWVFKFLLAVPGFRYVLSDSPVGRFVLKAAVYDPGKVPADLLRHMIPAKVTPGFMDAVSLGGRALSMIDPRGVTAPVLMIWGAEDHILPVSTAHLMEAELPDAELVVLDEVGHCAMFESPHQFILLVLDFLERQRHEDGLCTGIRASLRSWDPDYKLSLRDRVKEKRRGII